MPKRWLSRNGRHNDKLIISSPKGPVLHDNQAFDFAFTDLHSHPDVPGASLSSLARTNSENARPITSAGHVDKARKQLRIDVHLNRPRSTDGTLPSTTHLTPTTDRRLPSEEEIIGVAFGSPGHPPMAFCNDDGERSPRQLEHAFGAQSPFADRRLQPAKWKKLGNLFRTRPVLTKSRSGLLRDNHERQCDVGPRHHWHRQQMQTSIPVRVPLPGRSERPLPEKLHDGSDPKTVLDLRPSPSVTNSEQNHFRSGYPRARNESSVLRLQTSFSNSSSSLLARRSRTLESLKSGTWLTVSTDDESDAGDQARSARRQTTPTMSKPPSILALNPSASSPAASKYSLFPPAATIGTDRSPIRRRLERSMTSPARLSPLQHQHSSGSTWPAQQGRGETEIETTVASEKILPSPEEHTASTTRTDKQPWSTAHSQKSSASSAPTVDLDEIFFDIRSIRDSRGVEKYDHFVMTRPDSTQVSLARTRSKLNAASRTEKDSEDGSRDAWIPSRVRDQQQRTAPADAAVKGRTPEEEKQLRCEEEKLREIESRVQREIIEKRQKLIDQESKGPQIPTPVINDGRFSVSTAIFDEAIAAVEAISMRTSVRQDDHNAEVQAMVKENHALETTQAGTSAEAMSESAHRGPSRQQNLAMKLLPSDPGMPSSRQLQESKETAALRRTPTPEKATSYSERNLGFGPKDARDNARVYPPTSVKVTNERVGSSEDSSLSIPRKLLPGGSSVHSPPSTISEVSKASITSRLKLNDRPIEESPTIPQSPGPGKHNPNRSTLKEKPPPVPEKDAKFIPISKFAAKSTIEKVERAGVKATRVNRSVTDNTRSSPLVAAPTNATGLRKPGQKVEGSPGPARHDKVPGSKSPLLSHDSLESSPRIGNAQIKEAITIVQAKPAAEVSIARTVSLARKQSARVMVPGPKLQARRQEEEASKASQAAEETEAPDSQPTRRSPPAGLGLIMDGPIAFESGHRKTASSSSIDRRTPLNSNPSTPNYTIEHAVDKANREKAQKAAIVEAAKARARARRRAESQTREHAEREKQDIARLEQYQESQGDVGKVRWEIVEKKQMSPFLIQGDRGHKPGRSMNVVVESA